MHHWEPELKKTMLSYNRFHGKNLFKNDGVENNLQGMQIGLSTFTATQLYTKLTKIRLQLGTKLSICIIHAWQEHLPCPFAEKREKEKKEYKGNKRVREREGREMEMVK